MNILKSLVLIISLFNISFALLPPSPGPVDHRQYYDTPTSLYFSNGKSLNGIQAITQSGCNQPTTINVQQNYNPIILINETSYLASYYNSDTGLLDISVITNEGVFPIELQSSLVDFLKSNKVASNIYYDDSRNTFVFKNSNKQIIEYQISTNTISAKKSSGFTAYSEYYDLTTSSVYTAAYYNMSNVIYNFVLVYNLKRNSDFSYSMDDLKLTYELDSYQISSYNGSVVLFGNNKELSKSVLYLANVSFFSKENTFVIVAERSYGYSMVTGVNSRYVLLVNQDGTSTELIDLKTKSSQQYDNTCTQLNNNAIISSIAAKSIFSN